MVVTFIDLLFEPQGYFSWIPVVMLLFIITYLIIALFYMIARVMQRPDWEGRAKVEFARLVISLLMIIGIIGFAALLYETTSLMVGEGEDPFSVGRAYLARFAIGSVYEDSIPLNINILWDSAVKARVESTLITPAPSCMAGTCYTEKAGSVYIANNLEMMANVIIPFSASLVMQILALDFIKRYFLALLLPAGFILKILPTTRDAGAYLISLSLAFYFVYPMVYVLGAKIHEDVSKDFLKQLEKRIDRSALGDAYDFDDGDSLKAVTRLAYISPYALTLPLLAVILSIAAARSVFPMFSKDFIGEVPM